MTIDKRQRRNDKEKERFDRKPTRYFQSEKHWYFHTREGITMGPYESLEIAKEETERFIAFARQSGSAILRIMKMNSGESRSLVPG